MPAKAPTIKTLALIAINEYEEEVPARESPLELTYALDRSPPISLPPMETHPFKAEAHSIQAWLEALSKGEVLLKAQPRYYPEVKCTLLGRLAGLALPQEKTLAWDERAVRHKCLYEICIEGSSGRVVFWRLIEGDVTKKAEEYLKGLRFSGVSELIIKGQAEMIITSIADY